MSRWLIVAVFGLLGGCTAHCRCSWRTFDANGQFTMRLPPGMEYVKTQGVDSYVARFHGPRMHMSFDYGPYAGDFSGAGYGKPGLESHEETIHGKTAQITSWEATDFIRDSMKYMIGVNLPFLGMGISCRAKDDYVTALKIFRSIQFSKKRRWHQGGWVP